MQKDRGRRFTLDSHLEQTDSHPKMQNLAKALALARVFSGLGTCKSLALARDVVKFLHLQEIWPSFCICKRLDQVFAYARDMTKVQRLPETCKSLSVCERLDQVFA